MQKNATPNKTNDNETPPHTHQNGSNKKADSECGKGVEKWELAWIADGNEGWCSCCGKVCQLLSKLNTELLYDSAVPSWVHVHKI